MEVRFGFVAMSVQLEDASPSGNVTVKQAETLAPADRRLRCKKVAEKNLLNTLRILSHCKSLGIGVYRLSSRLVPLATHPLLDEWDFVRDLSPSLSAIGQFVRDNRIRVSFHPDHFNVLTSEDAAVREVTRTVLGYHVRLIGGMGLGRDVKLVLHLGGAGKDKAAAIERAIDFIKGLPDEVVGRIVLENDDKVFHALDVLSCAESAGLPVVLDVHHERCNPTGERLPELLRRCFGTWEGSGLPPKVHLSSPAGEGKSFRAHADWVDPGDFRCLWEAAVCVGRSFDVMVEAKQKDAAVLKLKSDLDGTLDGFRFEGLCLK